MTESVEETAQKIADKGRDALISRLRPAFEEAASAHADVLDLGPDQIEGMVQRAADRADGLQWRRALASVATEHLGISLGEALGHPAVERAQEIVGAPSYEESLAQLGAVPATGTTTAAAPAASAAPPAAAAPPAPAPVAAEPPAAQPAAEEPATAEPTAEEPAAAAEPEPVEEDPAAAEEPASEDAADEEPAAEDAADEEPAVEDAAVEDDSEARAAEPGAGATDAGTTEAAPDETDTSTEPGEEAQAEPVADEATGTDEAAAPEPEAAVAEEDHDADAEDQGHTGEESGEESEEQGDATSQSEATGDSEATGEGEALDTEESEEDEHELGVHGDEEEEWDEGEEGDWEDEEGDAYPEPTYAGVDGQETETETEAETPATQRYDLSAYEEQYGLSEPEAEDELRISVVHLGGIANLAPAERDVELQMAEPGLDIVRAGGDVLGRLEWGQVRSLEVPAGRRRLRKAGPTHLVIRTARGDASFEVPEVTPEELRDHLAPIIQLYLSS